MREILFMLAVWLACGLLLQVLRLSGFSLYGG